MIRYADALYGSTRRRVPSNRGSRTKRSAMPYSPREGQVAVWSGLDQTTYATNVAGSSPALTPTAVELASPRPAASRSVLASK